MTDVYFEIVVRRRALPYAPARVLFSQISYGGVDLGAPAGETNAPSLRVKVDQGIVKKGREFVVRVRGYESDEHVVSVFAWPEGADDAETPNVDERWVLLTEPPVEGKGAIVIRTRFPK